MKPLQFQPLQGPCSMKAGILESEMALVSKAVGNEHLMKRLEERKAANSPRQFAMFRPSEQVYVGDPFRIRWRENLREDDQIVNLVPVIGTIVRDYSWWAWSGVEIRDSIMSANEDPLVRAHLLYINSPGGMCAALPDVKFAVDHAHSKGIPVYALIDGMADSLAYGIAALCDKIYFVNPEDEVGSVGSYWAFWGSKPGAENEDGETFCEIYDAESFDKNRSYRDALEGNNEEALQELKYYRDYLVSIVTSGRPNMIDDQLHGKTFRAKDVIGTMVDEQGDLLKVAADAVLAYSSPEMEQARKAALANPSAEKEPSSPVAENFSTSTLDGNITIQSKEENNSPKQKTKKITYMEFKLLCQLLGVNSLEVDEEKGSYIQQEQLELLEAAISKNKSEAEELAASLQDMTSRATKAESEVERLNTELATAREEHTQYVNEQTEKLNAANTHISELEAENNKLAQTSGAVAEVEQPKNNNNPENKEGDDPSTVSAIKENMTLEEQIKAVQESKQRVGFA